MQTTHNIELRGVKFYTGDKKICVGHPALYRCFGKWMIRTMTMTLRKQCSPKISVISHDQCGQSLEWTDMTALQKQPSRLEYTPNLLPHAKWAFPFCQASFWYENVGDMLST